MGTGHFGLVRTYGSWSGKYTIVSNGLRQRWIKIFESIYNLGFFFYDEKSFFFCFFWVS